MSKSKIMELFIFTTTFPFDNYSIGAKKTIFRQFQQILQNSVTSMPNIK